MQKTLKRSLSLILSLLMVLSLFSGAIIASANAPVDVQFRTMDNGNSLGFAGGIGQELETENYLEGTGAIRATSNGGTPIFFQVYVENKDTDTVGKEAAGGEYLTFDLYVSDAAAISGLDDGDTSCNLISYEADGNWDTNSYGRIYKEQTLAMWKGLKTGWNHVTLKIEDKGAKDTLWAFRLYHTGMKMSKGAYMIMDDVRIMDQAAVDSILPARNAAKAVTIAISELPAAEELTINDAVAVEALDATYDALSDEYRALVKQTAKLEAAVARIAEIKAAGAVAANKLAVKKVVDAINALPETITVDDEWDVLDARDAYDALTDIQKALVINYDVLVAAEQTLETLIPVDEQFRSMDYINDIATSGMAAHTGISTDRLEGEGSVEFTAQTGDLYFFLYSLGQANNPIDISGATHLVFDMYVSTNKPFDKINGDAGVNMDDATHMNEWGQSAGFVSAMTVRKALNGLKPGWNHIVMPLDAKATTEELAAIRLYMTNTIVPADTIVRIDDIRFVNQAALDDTIAKQTAAKDLTVAIKNLPDVEELQLSDEAKVNKAIAAKELVDPEYYYMVQEFDRLDPIIAKMEAIKDAALNVDNQKAAQVVDDMINALPKTVTLEDKEAVEAARAAYDNLTDAQKALVKKIKVLKNAELTIQDMEPIDVQYRAFDRYGQDTAHDGSKPTKHVPDYTNRLEGKGSYSMLWENDVTGNIFVFFYHYNQGRNLQDEYVDDSDKWTIDYFEGEGGWKVPCPNIRKGNMKMTFDLYVSDPSVLLGCFGDAGLNFDIASPNAWGQTDDGGNIGRTTLMDSLLAANDGEGLKAGWNHVVVPLTFTKNVAGETITVYDVRLYFCNAIIPAGFQMRMDDVRFMNQTAVDTVLPERNKAKAVTIAISELAADYTYEDGKDIIALYAEVAEEYESLVIGYDEFLAAFNEKFADEIAAEKAADQAAADAVIALIDALPAVEELTVEDFEDVLVAAEAFDALTAEQQALVTNIAKLEAIVEAMAQWAIAAVEELIAMLPAPEEITLDDQLLLEAAEEAYAALTDEMKACVSNYDVLVAAREAFDNLPTYILGDINGDGEIKANDALEALKAVVGKADLTETQKLAGDVNKDGDVNAKDALEILKKIVGKPACF